MENIKCNGIHCKCMEKDCFDHHWADHCHCGKNGHALNSINCEVHGGQIPYNVTEWLRIGRERGYVDYFLGLVRWPEEKECRHELVAKESNTQKEKCSCILKVIGGYNWGISESKAAVLKVFGESVQDKIGRQFGRVIKKLS